MSDQEGYDSDDSEDINDFWGSLPEGVFDDEEGVDEEEEEVDLRVPGAEHLLVLLDCSPEMFQPCMDNKSPVDAVIDSLANYVRQTIKQSAIRKDGKRNCFGVHLFGTRVRKRLDVDEHLAQKLGERYKYNDKTVRYDDNDENSVLSGNVESDDEEDHMPKTSYSATTDLHELIPLTPPGLDTITWLTLCLKPEGGSPTSERPLDLKKEYGHTKLENAKENYHFAIKRAFREISTIFKDAKDVRKKGYRHTNPAIGDDTKTVWIFTSNPDPLPLEADQKSLKSMVHDLKKAGIQINVWPLPTPQRRGGFPEDSFFPSIVQVPPPREDEQDLDLEDLMAKRYKFTRPAFEVPLFFPGDTCPIGWDENAMMVAPDTQTQTQSLQQTQTQYHTQSQSQAVEPKEKKPVPAQIMLNFHVPHYPSRQPAKDKILRQVGVNDEWVKLEKIRILQGEETSEFVAKFVQAASQEEKKRERLQPGLKNVERIVKLKSKEMIPISPPEVKEIKRLAGLCGNFKGYLVLLGFKPRDAVPLHYNLKTYFAYPEDKVVEGSVEAFAHLHQSMIKKNVVGIGELYSHRGGGTSRLVSIHALPEEFVDGDEEEGQKCPPGWVVTHLPFENEVQEFPISGEVALQEDFEVSPEVLQATADIIKHSFADKFDAAHRSFNNPFLKKYWDYVEANALGKDMDIDNENEYILNPLSDNEAVEELSELMLALGKALPEEAKKTSAAKRKYEYDPNTTNWKVELQNGRLGHYKNDDLKEGLRYYGEKVSGNKAALVERLTRAIQEADD